MIALPNDKVALVYGTFMEIAMKVERFEDLRVYREARRLTNCVYAATKKPAFSRDYGIVHQMRRASVSVMSNIAEGFERGSNPEFIRYLFIAKGSCGELRAQLAVSLDQEYIAPEEYRELEASCIHLSRMLAKLIHYLKKSPLKGHKYK